MISAPWRGVENGFYLELIYPPRTPLGRVRKSCSLSEVSAPWLEEAPSPAGPECCSDYISSPPTYDGWCLARLQGALFLATARPSLQLCPAGSSRFLLPNAGLGPFSSARFPGSPGASFPVPLPGCRPPQKSGMTAASPGPPFSRWGPCPRLNLCKEPFPLFVLFSGLLF